METLLRCLFAAAFWGLAAPVILSLERRAAGAGGGRGRGGLPPPRREHVPRRGARSWRPLDSVADLVKLAAKEEPGPQDGLQPGPARDGLRAASWCPLLALFPLGAALIILPAGIDLAVGDAGVGVVAALAALIAVDGALAIAAGAGSASPRTAGGRPHGGPTLGGAWAPGTGWTPGAGWTLGPVLALGFAAAGAVAASGTLCLEDLARDQTTILRWNVFRQPIAFVLYMLAAHAVARGLSLDPTRPRPEPAGGGFADSSGRRLALWILVDGATVALLAGLATTLFLGGPSPGWELPAGAAGTAASLAAFATKTLLVAHALLRARWTGPPLGSAGTVRLVWKGLIPAALGNMVLTGAVTAVRDSLGG